jgi:23S rRNA (cytosine1962-C5)-methyltransferase
MKKIFLKSGKEKKILNFYQWIFKDDILTLEGQMEPGEVVEILSQSGIYLGLGFYNPDAHIPVRIITTREESVESALERKIRQAIRKRADEKNARYIAGEGDFLPGLIVDRFEDYLVLQIRNPGMYKQLNLILDLLNQLLKPAGMILRNDFETIREKHIPRENKVVYGTVPNQPVQITEGELKFLVDLKHGQKTGFFYDQKENRKRIPVLVKPSQVGLDLYTYTGAFGLYAAKAGATVTAVDISQEDLSIARKNAELNYLSQSINFVQSDVIRFLQNFRQEVDFIMCDPPALAKRKNELPGIQYMLVDLIIQCLHKLKPDGWMVIFSCSYLLDWSFMMNTIRIAASKVRMPVYLMDFSIQSPDHPILLQMPETLYLKGFWLRKGEHP